ncbi:MAG: 4-(cytidine 5'-diphospho)-2-C-methyl-D-erythritol kinase [Gemmatimonadota bacterium]
MTASRAVTSLAVATRAHAKLNLTLQVLAREESGFHQIETLFCAIELADDLEVSVRGDCVTLDVRSGAGASVDLGQTQLNLAYRAAMAFRAAAGRSAGAHIRLVKHIPAGAGLGGGSSDAAAVLRALNALHDGPLSEAALLDVGARLGSDVPFFLNGAPLALAWGRGSRLLPLPPLPRAEVLLAVVSEGVRTADAYGALAHRREQGEAPGVAPAVLALPRSWQDVAAAAVNDFEDIVFQRLPQLATLRHALADHGATLARMTGTGSVVFGIFEDAAVMQRAAVAVHEAVPGAGVLLTRTRT